VSILHLTDKKKGIVQWSSYPFFRDGFREIVPN